MDTDETESHDSGNRDKSPVSAPYEGRGALRTLLDGLAAGAYVSTLDGRVIDANPAFLQLAGARKLEDLVQHAGRLWPEPERRIDFIRKVIERGAVSEFELGLRRIDGEVIRVLDTCHAHREDGDVVALCGVVVENTEHRGREAHLAHLSVRDPLTGCYNRRYLRVQQHELERPSHFYGCLVLDLEHLREVNETYGHEEGDRVLRRFAHFVLRNKRADDVLVRLGDDEFALFVEVVHPDNLALISDRLVGNARTQSPIPFSIGHAYRRPGEPIEQLIARADAQMYEAAARRASEGERRREETGAAAAIPAED